MKQGENKEESKETTAKKPEDNETAKAEAKK